MGDYMDKMTHGELRRELALRDALIARQDTSNAELQHKLSLAEKERDDALKALGRLYLKTLTA